MSEAADLDLNALWRTIYGEAEAGDFEDAIAIGHVILNRVRLPNWPGSIRGVCYQPWQFSCWNNDNPRLKELNEVKPSASGWAAYCYDLAHQLIAGTGPADPTMRATHYYATYIGAPKWAKGHTPVYRTAGGKYTHLFFNDIDTPPPTTAKEALDQVRPVPGVKAQTVAAAAGVAGMAIPVETLVQIGQQIAPAWPAITGLMERAPVIFGAIMLAGIGWTILHQYRARRAGVQ